MELQVNDDRIIVVPHNKLRIEGEVVHENWAHLKSRLKNRFINAELSKYSELSNDGQDNFFDRTIRQRKLFLQRDGELYT